MEHADNTLDLLRSQKRELGDRIAALEETMLASSTPGIREFRRTRIQQLEDQLEMLGHRLRRLETAPAPAEAHQLAHALREANFAAASAFGR